MATIGETIRSARLKLGLSLDDVRNSTQIMLQQLDDIEHDDFSSFSAPVYAKGFIRLFARAVGLDPAPLVAQFVAGGSIPEQHESFSGTGKAHVKEESAESAEPKAADEAPEAKGEGAEESAEAPKEEAAEAPQPEAPADDLFSAPPEPAAAPAAAAAEKPAASDAPVPWRQAEKQVAATPLQFEKRVER
ncbi:MAG: helix-turn-helix domain-containing protein, partial [Kiritimatiellae bacterium]|nr:helix-turn-helix domain-containing protein [Kiritimatiellia bacterium]